MKPSHRSDGAAWQLEVFDAAEGRVTLCALGEGVRTLGSAPACDVVLPGGDVAERVAALEVGRWLVSVRPEAAVELRLNGERLGAQRRVVMLGDVLEVGGLSLRLLRAAAAAPQAGRARRRAGAAFALLCLAGGAVVLLGSTGLSLGRPSTPPVADEDNSAVLREFPEARWQRQPSGAEVVLGFVPSAADRQRLQDLVRRRDPAAVVQVQVVEELTRNAREFLADPALSVSYAGHGEWVVTGTTDDEAVKRKLGRLARDMKPLATVTDQVSLERIALGGTVAGSGTSAAAGSAGASGDHDWVALYSDGGGTRYWLGPDGTRHFVSLATSTSAAAPVADAPEHRGEPMARPADAPRVSVDEQRSRDADRRRILEQELKKEDGAQAEASAQGADEAAARHAANVEALKRELARLR